MGTKWIVMTFAVALSVSVSSMDSAFVNFTNIDARYGEMQNGTVSYNNAVLYYYREQLAQNGGKLRSTGQ
jgi:hypothetical protein